MIGWCTGIILTALRALALLGIAIGARPVKPILFAQIVLQTVLAGGLTYGVYRRQRSAALGLFVLWGISFVYSWVVSGRLIPPLGVLGLLLGYGAYRGVRGSRNLARLRAQSASAV